MPKGRSKRIKLPSRKRQPTPTLLPEQLDEPVDGPDSITVRRMLQTVAMQAARAVPGEAWPVYTFPSGHRTAERWANWMTMRHLPPAPYILAVRGPVLYVVNPEGRSVAVH